MNDRGTFGWCEISYEKKLSNIWRPESTDIEISISVPALVPTPLFIESIQLFKPNPKPKVKRKVPNIRFRDARLNSLKK